MGEELLPKKPGISSASVTSPDAPPAGTALIDHLAGGQHVTLDQRHGIGTVPAAPAKSGPTLLERRAEVAERFAGGQHVTLDQAQTDLGVGTDFDFAEALLRK